MTPKEATNQSKMLRLKSDNYSTKDFWILINNDSVVIAKQKDGEPLQAKITIPRSDFNRMIKWYLNPQSKSKA